MSWSPPHDLEYLVARLHGRRSRLAEGPRLESLCALTSVPELGRVVGGPPHTPALQRWIVRNLMSELAALRPGLSGADALLLDWMVTHFELANLKIRLRGILSRAPVDETDSLLWTPLENALSPDDLAGLLPDEPLGHLLRQALETCREHLDPFSLESALDHHYFRNGIVLASRLSDPDRNTVTTLIARETDIFHLMLVMRGRFHHHRTPTSLLPLHVEGTDLPQARFQSLLRAPDPDTAARLTPRRLLDWPAWDHADTPLPRPIDTGALEAQAWAGYLKLANRAFRQSPPGIGTIAGYYGLRRMEAVNLITLSEGLRLRLPGSALFRRMIQCVSAEALHV